MHDHSPAEGSTVEQPGGPIIGYRWFQVLDGGVLAGARGVPWPPDQPLRAEHVGDMATSEHPRRPPLSSVVWAALKPSERSTAGLAAAGVLVAVGLSAGPVIAGVVTAAVVALGWQMARRRQGLADAIVRVSGEVLVGCAALGSAGGVWLAADAGLAAGTSHWGATGRGFGAALACWVTAGAITGLLVGYFRTPGGDKHVCPSPPRRLGARWVPECGIYAYRTLPLAARAAGREWPLTAPVVLARVSLWGRVFPYSAGYRAAWSRIEALYDDASGHVEVPAALYGFAMEPLPSGLAVPATRGPRTARAVMSTAEQVRAWALRRGAQG